MRSPAAGSQKMDLLDTGGDTTAPATRRERFQRYTARARALGERARAELERIPGVGAMLESFDTEQKSGAPLLAGGLAYRLFFWVVAFGLLLAAALSFWSEEDGGGVESAAESFGLAGVAAHLATTAIENGAHVRW